LLAMHSSKIMSFIRILTFHRQEDAEDVFQQTCMVLWQKFEQYDPAGNFSAWACRMAHFETLRYRESKRRFKLLTDEALVSLADAAMPISAEVNDRRSALSNCLKKLASEDHELVRQRYFDGVSVEEMAKRIGCSTHAIYRKLSKIHSRLMRCIDRSTGEVVS